MPRSREVKIKKKDPKLIVERLVKDTGRKIHVLHGTVNTKRMRGEFAFVVIP